MTSLNNIILPDHISLHIVHNEHKEDYLSLEEFLNQPYYQDEDFDPQIIQRCVEADEIWEIRWYPITPVGFCRVFAPTLEEALLMCSKGFLIKDD